MDLKYGLDAEFGAAAAASAAAIAIGPALAEFAADAHLELRLTHLASDDVANDACVGAELRIGGESGVVVHGSGYLTEHVASIAFQETIALPIRPDRVGATEPDPGEVAPLVLVLGRPVATIKLSGSNRSVEAGSLLGGITYFADEEEGYETANASGFAQRLADHATQSGLSVSAAEAVREAFASRLDVRLASDSAFSTCSGSAPPNAISVAIALSGEESP